MRRASLLAVPMSSAFHPMASSCFLACAKPAAPRWARSAWRPAHMHMIVSAPGHRSLVTELFDAEDPYLDSDAVFGVRAPLVGLPHGVTG